MMEQVTLLIFLAAFMCVGAISVVLFGSSSGDTLRKRAEQLQTRKPNGGGGGSGTGDYASLKRTEKGSFKVVEVLAKRYVPNQKALKERLARSGYQISIGTYALINVGTGFVAFLIMTVIVGLSMSTAAAIGVAVGIMVPHLGIAYLSASRRARFLTDLPEALDLMVRGLKAGLPITESMATVSRELTGPIREEFATVSDGVRFGRSMDEMLWEAAHRLEVAEFKFFVISLSIQQETGGNLTETLSNLADIVRRRKQMKKKVKALSSEARASAYILGAMPFLMFLLMYFMNKEYISLLYTDPRGMVLLGAGITSMMLGGAIMAKMVRFEI